MLAVAIDGELVGGAADIHELLREHIAFEVQVERAVTVVIKRNREEGFVVDAVASGNPEQHRLRH